MAKISLIKLFTKEQHEEVLSYYKDNAEAAAAYTDMTNGKYPVSRQLVRYWRSIFMDNNGSKASANRGLQEARKLIQPSPTDDIGNTKVPDMCHRIIS